jgi:hypothetical protein
VTINHRLTQISRSLTGYRPQRSDLYRVGRAVGLAAVVLVVAQRSHWWPLSVLVVVAATLWDLRPGVSAPVGGRGAAVLGRASALAVGAAGVLIIAVVPRLVTQLVVAALYAVWLVWRSAAASERADLLNLLVVTAAASEAWFLLAAIWRTPEWLVLSLVWVGAYVPVYAVLAQRGERAAGVLAAAWALVSVEISWVLMLWLFVYTTGGGYGLVPQPALILTALAYCFGSIYWSQRQGTLSRARLTEYLLIGLILIVIVAIGTSWRGSI